MSHETGRGIGHEYQQDTGWGSLFGAGQVEPDIDEFGPHRPGTTVVADDWRGYSGLSKAEYKHQNVYHSKNEKMNADSFGNQSCGRLVYQGSAIFTPELCQDAFCAKTSGLLLAEYGWRRNVLAEQTLLATMKGCAARRIGEASFLQANRPDVQIVPLVSCVISENV